MRGSTQSEVGGPSGRVKRRIGEKRAESINGIRGASTKVFFWEKKKGSPGRLGGGGKGLCLIGETDWCRLGIEKPLRERRKTQGRGKDNIEKSELTPREGTSVPHSGEGGGGE